MAVSASLSSLLLTHLVWNAALKHSLSGRQLLYRGTSHCHTSIHFSSCRTSKWSCPQRTGKGKSRYTGYLSYPTDSLYPYINMLRITSSGWQKFYCLLSLEPTGDTAGVTFRVPWMEQENCNIAEGRKEYSWGVLHPGWNSYRTEVQKQQMSLENPQSWWMPPDQREECHHHSWLYRITEQSHNQLPNLPRDLKLKELYITNIIVSQPEYFPKYWVLLLHFLFDDWLCGLFFQITPSFPCSRTGSNLKEASSAGELLKENI